MVDPNEASKGPPFLYLLMKTLALAGFAHYTNLKGRIVASDASQ